MSGEEIHALREREGVSQAVLAHHLNVGAKLVSDWERGAKQPSGPSLKLLAMDDERPGPWRATAASHAFTLASLK